MATTRDVPSPLHPAVPPRPRPAPPVVAPDAEIARARRLATVLDRYYLDPILGLIVPGGGDVIGSLLGLYTVILAVRRNVSPVVIGRMLLNLGLDTLVGAVPLLGDLFDVGFKAHTRNLELLEHRTEAGGRATARDWMMVIGAALVFVAAIGLSVYLLGQLVDAIQAWW